MRVISPCSIYAQNIKNNSQTSDISKYPHYNPHFDLTHVYLNIIIKVAVKQLRGPKI